MTAVPFPMRRSGPSLASGLRGFKFDRHGRRKLLSHSIGVLSALSVVAVIYPLVSILYESVIKGGSVLLQPAFLTALPPNGCSAVSCSTVGIGPDIVGSLCIVGLASLIAVPIGVLAAVFASEYRTRGLGRAVSFTADVLSGVPSIIAGAVVYGYMVLYFRTWTYSLLSGSLALAILMIPIITRTTEEALRTVPNAMREAAIALGISKWKMTMRIVFIAALPGVATGVLLAVMRVAGDAAPLLFTAFGSTHYPTGINQPAAALPLLIWTYALSNESNWQQVAWGTTLFLLLVILVTNIISRYVIHRFSEKMTGNG